MTTPRLLTDAEFGEVKTTHAKDDLCEYESLSSDAVRAHKHRAVLLSHAKAQAVRVRDAELKFAKHTEAVKAWTEELGPYLGLDDGTMKPADIIEAAKNCRQFTQDTLDRATIAEAKAEAQAKRIGELEGALTKLMAWIDAEDDNREGELREREPFCNECTGGCTPYDLDKGPCAYHRAAAALTPKTQKEG